jgi:hypothetical protein
MLARRWAVVLTSGYARLADLYKRAIGKNSALLDKFYDYYGSKLWKSLFEVHRARLERFYARRGQAIIWAANLLHGGDRMRDLNRTRWSQVTHYNFERCSYYAPLGSDPVFGQIMFRHPVGYSSRKPIPNSVSDLTMVRQFIDAVAPKFGMNNRLDSFEPEGRDSVLAARRCMPL